MTLHVDTVSAENEVYFGPAAMLLAVGEMGELGILPRHAPLLTRIRPGPVRVRHSDGPDKQFFVSGGLLEVQPHHVTILADTAERVAEIDEAAAQRAKQRAPRGGDPSRRSDQSRADTKCAGRGRGPP